MENTRYIITYVTHANAGGLLLTYWATFAASAEEAVELFEDAHPGKQAAKVEPTDPARREMYGNGWLTDEEQEARASALRSAYDERRDAREEALDRLAAYSLDEFAARAAWEKERASGPSQNAEGVYIGDLFYCSWGYEQTNIDYFQVVALKGAHTAVVRRIGCKSEETACMEGYSRPVRNAFIGDSAYTVRTRPDRSGPYMKAPDDICSGWLRPCGDHETHLWTAYA